MTSLYAALDAPNADVDLILRLTRDAKSLRHANIIRSWNALRTRGEEPVAGIAEEVGT